MSKTSDEHLEIGCGSIVLGVLSCIGVLGYQSYLYLRYGYWQSSSFISVATQMGSEWAEHPSSWYGLHKVLDAVLLWIGLPIIFVVVGGLIIFIDSLD